CLWGPTMRTRRVDNAYSQSALASADGGTEAAAVGARWVNYASPSPATNTNALAGVVMTRTGGWAVGAAQSATTSTPLIERYAAARGTWSVVAAPKGTTGSLAAVAGTDADAWAVGESYTANNTRPLALHWNGTVWRSVALPAVTGGRLGGVSVRTAKDVWAVGSQAGRNGYLAPLALHWNGTTWSVVAVPMPAGPKGSPATARLLGVAVVPGSGAVLAVGTSNEYGRGSGNAFAETWTGAKWSLTAIAGKSASVDGLTSVVALSATNAWAVGSAGGVTTRTMVLHWTGTTWQHVTSPDPGNGGLSGVAAASPTSIWAVGTAQPAGSAWTVPLILHWNGTAWGLVPAPAAPIGKTGPCSGLHDAYQGLQAVANTPGSARAFAVGYHDMLSCGTGRYTLVERYS
ncbi:MAG: hypothetical protein QOG49_1783, partial [Frankiaceae bacterium]|nr:hypothetical protein [Frankiaceae bacterium]